MIRLFQILKAVVLASIFGWGLQVDATQSQPNFIFILTDDQRWDTLGCNGNTVIKTPHIDRLARDGVNFSNSFVTSPICVVSRASILTGQYMRTHGIRDFNRTFSPEQMAQTYPALLRKNGYFTGFTGKWGVGAEPYNYDRYKNEFDFWRGQPEQDLYWRDGKDGTHQNVRMSDDAEDFLAQAKASGKPFCLSLSYKAPHGPWHECEPDIFESIAQKEMPIPRSFTKEAWEAQPGFIQKSSAGVESELVRLRMFEQGSSAYHQLMVAQYYALIQGVDASVGRIRESLEKYEFDENTILIFTGDNGHFLHEKGLIGKWLLYEQSLRVPLVVYDPRLPKSARGKLRDEAVLNLDIAPTILALAGIRIPEKMQGADLSPLLRGESPEWRNPLFFEHTYFQAGDHPIPKSVGVRTDEWKYIRVISETPPYEQLFNLKTDVDELDNLAGNLEYKDQLNKLRMRCDTFRETIKDNFPDYQEYRDEYIVRFIDTQLATKPVQFTHVKSLGQTFPAETDFLTCCEIRMPTWARGEGPCDVIVELRQNGKTLKTLRIDKDDIENLRVQRLMFETPVQKGESLYLRLYATGHVPPSTMAWWAYDQSNYSGGTAFVDDKPQSYSHEVTMVFRK